MEKIRMIKDNTSGNKGMLTTPVYRYGSMAFRINAAPNKPVISKSIKRMVSQIESLLSHYSRGYFLFFSLHNSPITENSTLVSDFFRELKRHAIAIYGEKRLIYAWGKERDRSTQFHYHAFIGLDGSKVSNASRLIRIINGIWGKLVAGGHVHYPKNCFYLAHRADYMIIGDLVYRASYIAKLRTKEDNPTPTRRFSTSSVAKNPDKQGFDFSI
jgi:hypothetical protein